MKSSALFFILVFLFAAMSASGEEFICSPASQVEDKVIRGSLGATEIEFFDQGLSKAFSLSSADTRSLPHTYVYEDRKNPDHRIQIQKNILGGIEAFYLDQKSDQKGTAFGCTLVP